MDREPVRSDEGQGRISLQWDSSLSLKLLGPTITICRPGSCLKCTNPHVL